MKRKICFLLALIMLLGVMPVNVFAQGEADVSYPITIKMYNLAEKN